MKETESIPVWVKIIKGKTVCVCNNPCNKRGKCTRDIVERDLFRGWQDELNRDKYGRSKG